MQTHKYDKITSLHVNTKNFLPLNILSYCSDSKCSAFRWNKKLSLKYWFEDYNLSQNKGTLVYNLFKVSLFISLSVCFHFHKQQDQIESEMKGLTLIRLICIPVLLKYHSHNHHNTKVILIVKSQQEIHNYRVTFNSFKWHQQGRHLSTNLSNEIKPSALLHLGSTALWTES